MMQKLIKKRGQKSGLPAGTLIHIGDQKADKIEIEVIHYNKTEERREILTDVSGIENLTNQPPVSWINVNGLHDTRIIEKIGAQFEIHPLLLEDILNTDHRPKLENFDRYLLIMLKMLTYDDSRNSIQSEQVSLILGATYVITFQEQKGDVFNSIRLRIKNDKGRIRTMAADYLAYALLDAIVDAYFQILEKIGDQIEALETELLNHPRPEVLRRIHRLKREIILIRKTVWPLREVISELERGDSELIHETSQIFLRDVYDHTIQIMDTVETFRDMLAGMLDTYLSVVNYRMNEVMKVLTVITTLFIPLSFIAGIYGMNFKNMPELEWNYGYFGVLLVMLLVSVGMLFYFRKKDWL
jgi:magnesium transporter